MKRDLDLNPFRYHVSVNEKLLILDVVRDDNGEWVDSLDFDDLAHKYNELKERHAKLLKKAKKK